MAKNKERSEMRGLEFCGCGCGKTFKPTSAKQRYAGDACRKRANRRERGETPPAVTRCACGCGELAVGVRKRYATEACKQRAYRKRKEFDELGGEFEWSERPETPRKADKQGLTIKLWVEP